MFLHVVMVVMVHHAVAHIIGDVTLGYGGVSAASGFCFLRTSYERSTRVSGDVHGWRRRRSSATIAAIFKRFGLRLRGVLPWGSLGRSRTGLRRPNPQPAWGSWGCWGFGPDPLQPAGPISCPSWPQFAHRPRLDPLQHRSCVTMNSSFFAAGRTCPPVFFCGRTVLCCSGFLAAQPTYRLTGWYSAQLESSGLCNPAEATKS